MGKSRPAGRDDGGHARRIARAIDGCRRVVISAHVRPDGDAVGSVLALSSILRERGLKAEAVLDDDVPRPYLFLGGAKRIRRPSTLRRSPGCAFVALDSTSRERLGAAAAVAESCSKTIVIDHHVSNVRFGDVNWVEPDASSVGEMVYRLVESLRWKMPRAALEPIYTAIMSDTGRFSYSNTTADSFRIAGAIVAKGVDPARVAGNVYGNRTLGEWSLEARARASLVVEPGGRIATLGVTARDFRETRTRPAGTQDLPALSRTLAGVEIGLFFYEIDGGRRTRVNVRTTEAVDADRFAGRFGGGGHRRAAGCTVDGSYASVRAKVVAEAKKLLRGARGKRRRT